MIVNPDVNGYTKTLNQRKILRKTQKNNLPVLKTKIILKPKYKLIRGPFFTFSLPGGGDSPLCPISVTPLPNAYRCQQIAFLGLLP